MHKPRRRRPAIKSKTIQASIASSASAITVLIAILPKMGEIASVLGLGEFEQFFVALAGLLTTIGPVLAVIFRIQAGGVYTAPWFFGPNKEDGPIP